MILFQGLKTIFKKYMIAGTAVLVPLIGTYLILKFIILSIDNMMISLLPLRFQPQQIFGQYVPGLGLIATIILILFMGLLTRLYIGKMLMNMGDRIISKIPLGRGIYSGMKQFVSTVISGRKDKFKSVVVIEYPRKGCWVIGFLTSESMGCVQGLADDTMVNVFVPTTPNPTSGYLAIIPKRDVRRLDIGVDEAFKIIISGGIVHESPAA